MAEHLPKTTAKFLVYLIEAAGQKALDAGYSQNAKRGAASARPTRNKFAKAIRACMKLSKKKGIAFKTFIADWEAQPIAGLALRADAIGIRSALHQSKYTVTDQNGERGKKGPLGEKPYAGSTLQKFYSQAN